MSNSADTLTPFTLGTEASGKMHLKIEQHVRMCLQPKPRWLPQFAWLRILKRLVVLEMTAPKFTVVPR